MGEEVEVWKRVDECDSYFVSNKGNIRNERVLINGRVKITYPKGVVNNWGYRMLCLSNKKYKKLKSFHRLVSTYHIPNPDNKPFVNHIDGNKLNNAVENLEWCTPLENVIHAYENKLQVCGKLGKWHRAKPVIDLNTDKTYDCLKSACIALGYNYSTQCLIMTGKIKNKTGLKYI